MSSITEANYDGRKYICCPHDGDKGVKFRAFCDAPRRAARRRVRRSSLFVPAKGHFRTFRAAVEFWLGRCGSASSGRQQKDINVRESALIAHRARVFSFREDRGTERA